MRKGAWVLGALALLTVGSFGTASADSDPNAFFRELNDKPRADFRDLVTVAHILTRDQNEAKPFEQARAEMVTEGVVPDDWTYRPDSPVTLGMVSYVLCSALSEVKGDEYAIEGGVTMMIFGNSRRYAMRECVHLRLVPQKPTESYITGADLLGTLSRAAKYRKTGRPDALQFDEEDKQEEEVAQPEQERQRQQEAK